MDTSLTQASQQVSLQTPQLEKNSAKVFWAYLIAITLVITLGLSGYLIGFEQASNKQSSAIPKITLQSQPSQPPLPPGIQKSLDSFKTNPQLLYRTRIAQTYVGTLTSFVPEKSWTLEKNGETITINNEANNKVEYFTIVLKSGGNDNPLQPNNKVILKVGDYVGVTRSLAADGKNSNIDRVVLGIQPQGTASATSPPPSTAQ